MATAHTAQLPRTANKNFEQRTCYNCNEKGHLSINCTKAPRRVRCENCSRVGHNRSTCPDASTNRTFRVNLIQTSFNEYNKMVVLNESHLEAFIDLGSECSLIRIGELARLGIPLSSGNVELRGFAGGQCRTLGFADIKLSIDKVSGDVRLYAVENDKLVFPVLIGRDFFDQPHIRLVKEL